jgi:hypothetical protein
MTVLFKQYVSPNQFVLTYGHTGQTMRFLCRNVIPEMYDSQNHADVAMDALVLQPEVLEITNTTVYVVAINVRGGGS